MRVHFVVPPSVMAQNLKTSK